MLGGWEPGEKVLKARIELADGLGLQGNSKGAISN